jgi:putative DNA primase/helicase
VPEILFIAHGAGSNGKTTELETIAQILGQYSHAADAGLLTTTKEAGGPTPEIVALRGKRAIFINETAQSDWLNEARVKHLAATDQMSGRGLHQSPINWSPTHKPWLRTNHKPKIRGTDFGLWRRIHYIPYTETIQTADAILNFREVSLIPELPGILNWLIEGWMDYLKAGRKLNPPACVQDCVARYKKESDITGQWVAAATFPDPSAGRKPLNGLYKEYRKWFLEEHGEKGHVAIRTLGNSLEAAGYTRETGQGGYTYFKGLSLVETPLEGCEAVNRVTHISLPTGFSLGSVINEKNRVGGSNGSPSKNPFRLCA